MRLATALLSLRPLWLRVAEWLRMARRLRMAQQLALEQLGQLVVGRTAKTGFHR